MIIKVLLLLIERVYPHGFISGHPYDSGEHCTGYQTFHWWGGCCSIIGTKQLISGTCKSCTVPDTSLTPLSTSLCCCQNVCLSNHAEATGLIKTQTHVPAVGATNSLAFISGDTTCITCTILNEATLYNTDGLQYAASSYITIQNGVMSYPLDEPFYLTFDLECKNDFPKTPVLSITGFQIFVECQASSVDIVIPASYTDQTFFLDESADPYFFFTGWTNNRPNCKIFEYWASCGAAGVDTACTNGVDSTRQTASIAQNNIFLETLTYRLVKGTYTFTIWAHANNAEQYMPISVNLIVDCGPSSVAIITPTYTQLQQHNYYDPAPFVFVMPLLQAGWSPSMTPTTVCALSYQLFDADELTTPPTYFEDPPVIGADTQVLLKTINDGRPGIYDFKIKVTAEGGASGIFLGRLEIMCTAVIIQEPSDLNPHTFTYPVEPNGSFQDFNFSPFASNQPSQCPAIFYGIYTTNDGTFPPPDTNIIIFPKVGCIENPCRTFQIRTDTLLSNYQIHIYARADPYAFGYSQVISINVVCRTDAISHILTEPTLQIVQTQNSLEAINLIIPKKISPTDTNFQMAFDNAALLLSVPQRVFVSDLPQCDVQKFELYSDQTLLQRIPSYLDTINLNECDSAIPIKIYREDDRTLTQIQVFNQDPIYKELYVKGLSQDGQYDVIPIAVVVCGNEIIRLTKEGPEVLNNQLDTQSSGIVLTWPQIDQFFVFEKGPMSSLSCQSDLTIIYEDQELTAQILNPIEITVLPTVGNEFEIQINNFRSFPEKSFYLHRTTKGGVGVYKQLIVEVCGHESVTLIDPTKELVLNFNSQSTQPNQIPVTEYSGFFKSSSNYCLITGYELVQSLNYDPFLEKNVQMNPDFSLTIDDKIGYQSNQLFIKAYTKQGKNHGYLPLKVKVQLSNNNTNLNQILNTGPQFEQAPKDILILVSNQTSKQVNVQFENIIDKDQSLTEIDFECDGVGIIEYTKADGYSKFKPQNFQGISISYDAKERKIQLSYPDQSLMVGTNLVQVTLKDKFGKENVYKFNIKFTRQNQELIDKISQQLEQNSHRSEEDSLNKLELVSKQQAISAKIAQIDQFGHVLIKFNTTMRNEIVNISMLNQSYFDLYIRPSNDWIMYESFNISNLNFTWNVTSYEKDEMAIDLNFTDPNFISLKLEQDSLIFHIRENASDIFQGKIIPNSFLSSEYFTLQKKIPRQIYQTDFVKSFTSASKSTKEMLKGSLVGSVVINLFLAGTLSQILCFINPLQLILHLPIMAIIVPANALTMFKILIPIVMFDILEDVEFIDNMFDSNEEDSNVLDQMKQLGYETPNVIKNLGTLYVLMVFYFLKLGIIAIFTVLGLFTKRFEKAKAYLIKSAIFGEFIYLFHEGYIEYLLSGVIGFEVRPGSVDDIFIIHFTTFVVLIGCIILPVMYIYVLSKKMEDYVSTSFKQIWQASYHNLKTNRGKIEMSYNLIFVIRRIIFIMISFLLQRYSAIQIQILLYMSTFTLIFQGYFDPLSTRRNNYVELFNEVCIYLCSLHLIAFTDMVPDLDTQSDVGWSLIFVVSLNIIVNLSLFFEKVIMFTKLVFIKCRNGGTKSLKNKIQFIKEKFMNNKESNVNNQTSINQSEIELNSHNSQNRKKQKNKSKKPKVGNNNSSDLIKKISKKYEKNLDKIKEDPEESKDSLPSGDDYIPKHKLTQEKQTENHNKQELSITQKKYPFRWKARNLNAQEPVVDAQSDLKTLNEKMAQLKAQLEEQMQQRRFYPGSKYATQLSQENSYDWDSFQKKILKHREERPFEFNNRYNHVQIKTKSGTRSNYQISQNEH